MLPVLCNFLSFVRDAFRRRVQCFKVHVFVKTLCITTVVKCPAGKSVGYGIKVPVARDIILVHYV